MVLKKAFLVLGILFVSVQLSAFQLSKSIKKKVDKELVKNFDGVQLSLEPVLIDASVNAKLSKQIGKYNLFAIQKENTRIGYAYVDKAPSKTDQFDYLILLDSNLIIMKAKVLLYREDYGGEIGSKRWLKQFIGKSSQVPLKYRKDIIAISGATISASSMTRAINAFLKNLIILKQENTL